MRILDAAAVRAALPMADAVEVARATFAALGDGTVQQPARTFVAFNQPAGVLAGLMPCGLGGDDPAYTVKLVSLVPGNAARGIPTISGMVAVFDGNDGAPVAILDGATITSIRTAAASGLATRYLAAPDAGDLAILGAGAQGRAHLEAMAAVRPVRNVRVWNRTPGRAEEFAKWAADQGFPCTTAATPGEAARGADLVCLCTGSGEALISSADVADGAHVNAIGAFSPTTREVTADLLARSRVVVDDLEAAREEAGDVLLAINEGAISWSDVSTEMADLVRGPDLVPREPGEVTFFKSVGISAEDAFAAIAARVAALESGLGVEVPFP